MADLIAAEEGALKRGAQAVGSAKAGIDNHMKNVRTEIEDGRRFWTGEAAGSYQSLMTRWDEEARKLNNILITLEDALTGTDRDQAATEESHQQTISGLTSMMGS